jgi:hypothetical protein
MTQPEIEHEIQQTRELLGQTVEELAARADMKARARDKATEVKAKARDKAAELSGRMRQSQTMQRRWPLAVTVTGLVIAASAAFWGRRKT